MDVLLWATCHGRACAKIYCDPSEFLSEAKLDCCQYAQMGLIAVIMVIISNSVISLQAKQGLPRLNQVAAWMILGVS